MTIEGRGHGMGGMTDKEYAAKRTRGEAFARRWLLPLLPQALQMERDGYAVEWAVPDSLWYEDLFGTATEERPAMFYGIPIRRDSTLTSPAIRHAYPGAETSEEQT